MDRDRGQRCGYIELTGYLTNSTGPVPLVQDLRNVHDRLGSSFDPSLNGHVYYPNDVDRPLNETTTDTIRAYHTDYNNRPSNIISLSSIPSTSGHLHNEFVDLLILQTHRETDRFFPAS